MPLRTKGILIILLFALLALSACRAEEIVPRPDPDPKELITEKETIVHVAGWGGAPTGSAPLYWLDGELEYPAVCRGTGILAGEGYAHSLFLSGGNVYLAGWIWCKDQRLACYWKNGARTDLESPRGTGYAQSVFVSGQDVYVAGWIDNSNRKRRVPCYWKNGEIVELSRLGQAAEAWAIFVSGPDVFVAGNSRVAYGREALPPVPCFWKNGARKDLSTTGSDWGGLASAIHVLDGRVHVAGSAGVVPCLWIDGVRTDLSRLDESFTGWANSIQATEGGVYVGGATQSGTCEKIPCYWHDGERTDLSVVAPGRGGWVSSIFILEDFVFAAGYGNTGPSGEEIYPAIPCYWRNGERVDLPTGIYPEARLTAIQALFK